MKQDLEKLKSAVDALKIFGKYVQLRKEGSNYVGLCPFHREDSGSFKVTNKGDGWFYKCFGCNTGGDIINFVERIENTTTAKAIDMLRAIVGRKDFHEETEEVERRFTNIGEELSHQGGEKPKIKLTMAAWERFEKAFSENTAAHAWFVKRGIPVDVAKTARVGFCQTVRGHVDDEENRNAGWIMFPRVYGDEILTVKMRCIAAKDFSQITNMRQDTLFNIDTISPFEPVFVTEGEPDALALEAAGFRAVSVSNMGQKLTPEMKKKLKEASHIFFAGDNDGGDGTEYMRNLRKEFKENTYLILWPDVKDANDFLLKICGGDLNKFRTQVTKLAANAKSNPIEGVYSLTAAMDNAEGGSMMDNPRRLHWRQRSIDRMAIVPPKGVAIVYSSYPKSGKTTLVADPMVHEARRGESVLIYSAELTLDENIRIVASHVLQKDRDRLTKEDFKECARILRSSTGHGEDFKYYIGYNPELQGHDAVLDFIETAVRTFGITRVVLDHVHHIIDPGEGGSMNNAEIRCAKRIKDIATRHDLIFIVVGQSNKEGQNIKNIKNDEHGILMGSSAWLNVAHAIYLLHRKKIEVTDPENPPKDLLSGDSDIILKYVRTNGPGHPFTRLLFLGEKSTFAEKTFQEAPPQSKNDSDSI